MNGESRKFQQFSQTLPPVFGDFARAYLKKLSAMAGAEIEEKFSGDALEKIKRIFPEKFAMNDENFRAKNIGEPHQLPRRDLFHDSIQGRAELERYLSKRKLELSNRPSRPLFGVKISDDESFIRCV